MRLPWNRVFPKSYTNVFNCLCVFSKRNFICIPASETILWPSLNVFSRPIRSPAIEIDDEKRNSWNEWNKLKKKKKCVPNELKCKWILIEPPINVCGLWWLLTMLFIHLKIKIEIKIKIKIKYILCAAIQWFCFRFNRLHSKIISFSFSQFHYILRFFVQKYSNIVNVSHKL